MYERDVKFINVNQELSWSSDGFLQNPNPVNEGALTLGNAFDARSFRDAVLTAVGTGMVTVYGSAQKDPPDFSQDSSINNSYVTIMLADYHLANTIYNGDTGVSVADSTSIAELNTNLLTWIGIKRSADTVAVFLTEASTQ